MSSFWNFVLKINIFWVVMDLRCEAFCAATRAQGEKRSFSSLSCCNIHRPDGGSVPTGRLASSCEARCGWGWNPRPSELNPGLPSWLSSVTNAAQDKRSIVLKCGELNQFALLNDNTSARRISNSLFFKMFKHSQARVIPGSLASPVASFIVYFC